MMHQARVFFMQCAAAFILTILLAPLTQAQPGNPTFTGSSRSDALQTEQRRQFEGAMIERALEAPAGTSQKPGINLAEFRTDFLKLQVVNNSLLKSISATEPLNLKFIARSTAEIRKIGQRLQASRALPKSVASIEAPKAAVDPAQLRLALGNLDRVIVEFVRNPIFESTKVIDAEWSAKARRDLDEIIALSGQLKKNSEKLSQAAAKSR